MADLNVKENSLKSNVEKETENLHLIVPETLNEDKNDQVRMELGNNISEMNFKVKRKCRLNVSENGEIIRHQDEEEKVIGSPYLNPNLNTCMYTVQFGDINSKIYSANTLGSNIYSVMRRYIPKLSFILSLTSGMVVMLSRVMTVISYIGKEEGGCRKSHLALSSK